MKKTVIGAQWLLSYANHLYVALNLFLFGYGSSSMDIFKVLNDISRYFQENGNQSKQFPPVHKMAHVWGTADVAFYLSCEEYNYLVCASIMRVSFESLNINLYHPIIKLIVILNQ